MGNTQLCVNYPRQRRRGSEASCVCLCGYMCVHMCVRVYLCVLKDVAWPFRDLLLAAASVHRGW